MEKAEAPFTAEGYLRASSGPFAPYFRRMVPDVDGRDALDLEKIEARWKEDLDRFAAHYDLSEEQRTDAEEELRNRMAIAEDQFLDLEFSQKVKKYLDDLEHYLQVERDPRALANERAQAYKERTTVDTARRELVAVVDAWSGALHDAWTSLLTDEQAERNEPPLPWRRIDWINTLTKIGLTAVGLGLLLGLFTPLAALGGAGYLLMFYLSMPPWPGLPSNPVAEGHYLIVNKNLIEMIACLALACLPTGHWVGLDALLFGWVARRRADAEIADADMDATRGFDGSRDPRPLTRSD